MDPDHDRHSVGPGLGPKCLQRLSEDDKSQWQIQRGFGGSLELPFETKLSNFHGEFSKNQEKLINNQVNLN